MWMLIKKILLFQAMKRNIDSIKLILDKKSDKSNSQLQAQKIVENITRKISVLERSYELFFNKAAALADIRVETNDSLIVSSLSQNAN